MWGVIPSLIRLNLGFSTFSWHTNNLMATGILNAVNASNKDFPLDFPAVMSGTKLAIGQLQFYPKEASTAELKNGM